MEEVREMVQPGTQPSPRIEARGHAQSHLALLANRLTPETVSARVKRLSEEARGLAREHVHELLRTLLAMETMALEIASGGEAYPAGVRDIARRLADDCATKAQTLAAINGRAS